MFNIVFEYSMSRSGGRLFTNTSSVGYCAKGILLGDFRLKI